MNNGILTIVISYCSNERAFIHALLTQALQCAEHVIVTVGTHTYDFQPEDTNHIQHLAATYPNATFVYYPVSQEISRTNPLQYRKDAFWHNVSRIAGWRSMPDETEWVLFLDADEIPHAPSFLQWYRNIYLNKECAYKLANYWYFREPIFQATTFEDSVLLVHASKMSYDRLMRDMERDGIVEDLPCRRMQLSVATKLPMFHHFSWVRTKEDMIKKVSTWGHKTDRDWVAQIETEFSGPFSGTDFVHNYSYVTVPNMFNITLS
jgi:hypothetical protein